MNNDKTREIKDLIGLIDSWSFVKPSKISPEIRDALLVVKYYQNLAKKWSILAHFYGFSCVLLSILSIILYTISQV